MNKLETIIGDYSGFLNDVLTRTANEGFDFGDFVQIDHLDYRTISLENYEEKKSQLQEVAELKNESIINGRPISTYLLNETIAHPHIESDSSRLDPWQVDVVELIAPKDGSDFPEGPNHVEYVLRRGIPEFLEKYKGKPFEMRAADRGINPEVGLPLGNLMMKVHNLSLLTVVDLQRRLGFDEISDNQTAKDLLRLKNQ